MSKALSTRDSGVARELRHCAWLKTAQLQIGSNPFSSGKFALLAVYIVLDVGSIFLFEERVLLRTDHSATALSELSTIVTLEGRDRH